jgi:hypothetical protein
MLISAFTYSDWASDPDDRCSTGGLLCLLEVILSHGVLESNQRYQGQVQRQNIRP